MQFHYTESVDIRDIPCQPMEHIGAEVAAAARDGWRMIQFCGLQDHDDIHHDLSLLCLMSHDGLGDIRAWRSTMLAPDASYPSLTPATPQAHWFEREIFEQWHITPVGHPWLKPVRFCPPMYDIHGVRPLPGDTHYFTVKGSQTHEVAVGPVHAGVIEPGHFRFQCHGEQVIHLEISLGFQHRGVERALLHGPDARTPHLMECLAGDTSIGHGTAAAALMECLAGRPATERAQSLRRVMLELERLACHTGDLGAIAGDTGFLPTSAWCGRIRGDWLNTTALICGNRFGRGMVRPGGVLHDVDAALLDVLAQRLDTIHRDTRGAVDAMFASDSVLDRMHNTGIVSRGTAQDLGLVGMAARASGVPMDARFNYPLAGFAETQARLRTQRTGDVFCRARQRDQELDDAVAIIRRELGLLAALEEPCMLPGVSQALPPHRLAVSFCEGWRGTICHAAVTDARGRFALYKPVDPSFHNWIGLAMALRGEQISDFPLCNKSFNLSYCGHDL
ncbi:MAG: NADH-quinone oxidoreductase subunit C [Desulfovibrionaceae bacterium]|nr:NADH-quinone oxidoreductase subunit C [Desulfovibrionaceae bacterium]